MNHSHVSKLTLMLLGVAGALSQSSPARADEPTPPGVARLWTFDELARSLNQSSPRILDVRPRTDYDRGHIPGALWLDVKAAAAASLAPNALTDVEAWKRWIRPLGLTPEIDVVIVDGGRQLDAARLWWLLSYLGVKKAGLLDGNFGLWAREGRAVSTVAPTIEPTDFPVELQTARLATRDQVAAALSDGSSTVIDARSDGEYAGERKVSKRGGHIPTACHLEWIELVDMDGRFTPPDKIRPRIEALKIAAGRPLITHCQSGGRASVNSFMLERLGFPTRNYYLGWSDWGNADDTPVAEGTEAGQAPK